MVYNLLVPLFIGEVHFSLSQMAFKAINNKNKNVIGAVPLFAPGCTLLDENVKPRMTTYLYKVTT